MQKPEKEERPEKRFDVRVPVANTVLLDLLAEESELTGIVESRLLVQYATLYAQQRRGLTLAALPGIAAQQVITPATAASNGHRPEKAPSEHEAIQPTLSGDDLDSLFGDPD